MKSYGFWLGGIVLAGCAAPQAHRSTLKARDLSRPAGRLVGHWHNGAQHQFYYGRADPKTKHGSYLTVTPSGYRFNYRHYSVIADDTVKNQVTVRFLYRENYSPSVTCTIPADGQSMSCEMQDRPLGARGHPLSITWDLTYSDDKMAP